MRLSRRNSLGLALLALVAVPVAIVALSRGSSAGPVSPVFAEGGIAIGGTDPVAYFTQGRPRPGDPAISADWMGARWLFASDEHRALFVADPAAHAPQFGGYCSWAVAQGYTAPIDPAAWKIVDGKLYLNYSPSVQRKWARDIPGNITRATANWPGLRG